MLNAKTRIQGFPASFGVRNYSYTRSKNQTFECGLIPKITMAGLVALMFILRAMETSSEGACLNVWYPTMLG